MIVRKGQTRRKKCENFQPRTKNSENALRGQVFIAHEQKNFPKPSYFFKITVLQRFQLQTTVCNNKGSQLSTGQKMNNMVYCSRYDTGIKNSSAVI